METPNRICPVCGQEPLVSTVQRSTLPAMQNYVFPSSDLARAAKSGRLDLAVCAACGFAHNASFDPTLLNYDEGYDNSVPSSVMLAYYKEIATYLHETYALNDGLIIDVGCGKGTLLKVLCDLFPTVRGLGIDPSYEGDEQFEHGRLVFIKDFFSVAQIVEQPSVVICRHVLEHIPQPISFLKSIWSALAAFPETPLFFEVPDTNWITEHGAFWDFCHEHCNYFTPDSLDNSLSLTGFPAPYTTQTAFGDQYIWIEVGNPSMIAHKQTSTGGAETSQIVNRLTAYADTEVAIISQMREKLVGMKKDGFSLALWGMATKGVVFSLLVDPETTLIDVCVDINPNKQHRFAPISGRAIEPPSALCQLPAKPLMVVVMNPNYVAEIREMCTAMSLDPLFMDASGNPL